VESEAWLAKCCSLVAPLGRNDVMGSINFEAPRHLALQRRDNFVIVVAGGGSADVFDLGHDDPTASPGHHESVAFVDW
jgi:hypothetical protein